MPGARTLSALMLRKSWTFWKVRDTEARDLIGAEVE
jgi:hypothetical protein